MTSSRVVIPGEAHAAFGMAAFVGIGGAVALSRGSKRSALFSGLYALGYLASGEAIRRNEAQYGHSAATLLGAFLSISMGFRYAATKKVFPPVVVGGAAALSTAYHAYKWYQWTY
ncbi:hypothetical protein BASA81_006101 [Batrachochytrium salamandrivorans]|nr:hypothetical protein BASA81_006101 [Batrachochytrium salamandrivorans]